MSPKEKALKLVDKFYPFTLYTDATLNGKRDAYNRAKQSALIAVDTVQTTLWNAAAGGIVNIKDSDENFEYW